MSTDYEDYVEEVQESEELEDNDKLGIEFNEEIYSAFDFAQLFNLKMETPLESFQAIYDESYSGTGNSDGIVAKKFKTPMGIEVVLFFTFDPCQSEYKRVDEYDDILLAGTSRSEVESIAEGYAQEL